MALVYGNNGRSAGDAYGGASDAYGSGGAGLWFPYGMTSPGAFHALMMRRHMEEFGTTTDPLGTIAATFRRHASLNPDAVMRTPFTLEEYRAARYICEPLRLLDYCLINDGGVAMILTSAERARDSEEAASLLSGASAGGKRSPAPRFRPMDFWFTPMRAAAAQASTAWRAWRRGHGRAHDLRQLHADGAVLLEGFGFLQAGRERGFVADGHSDWAGISDQHERRAPFGVLMQGWALNVEAVRQVRGECGERQVKGAELVQYMTAAPVITSIIYGK